MIASILRFRLNCGIVIIAGCIFLVIVRQFLVQSIFLDIDVTRSISWFLMVRKMEGKKNLPSLKQIAQAYNLISANSTKIKTNKGVDEDSDTSILIGLDEDSDTSILIDVESIQQDDDNISPVVTSPVNKEKKRGGKTFVCGVCGKSFDRNSNLRIHSRIHSGEKPFECEKCNKSFTRFTSLRNHVRMHSGERPYCCEKCGKAFADRSNFRKHVRIHTDEKPYSCKVCGKSFVQSGALHQHERVHSGEKPYKCKECDRCFPQMCGLRRHIKAHKARPFKKRPTTSNSHTLKS